MPNKSVLANRLNLAPYISYNIALCLLRFQAELPDMLSAARALTLAKALFDYVSCLQKYKHQQVKN